MAELLNDDFLMVNTVLAVKLGTRWVHYLVPVRKNNGLIRTIGHITSYFRGKRDFRMAVGYVWNGRLDFVQVQQQWLYFDSRRQEMEMKELKRPIRFSFLEK